MLFSTSLFAGETLVLEMNKDKKFQDHKVKLTNINDSICKEVCIWAGNIVVDIIVNEKKYSFTHYPKSEFEEKAVLNFKYKIMEVDTKKKTAIFEITPIK